MDPKIGAIVLFICCISVASCIKCNFCTSQDQPCKSPQAFCWGQICWSRYVLSQVKHRIDRVYTETCVNGTVWNDFKVDNKWHFGNWLDSNKDGTVLAVYEKMCNNGDFCNNNTAVTPSDGASGKPNCILSRNWGETYGVGDYCISTTAASGVTTKSRGFGTPIDIPRNKLTPNSQFCFREVNTEESADSNSEYVAISNKCYCNTDFCNDNAHFQSANLPLHTCYTNDDSVNCTGHYCTLNQRNATLDPSENKGCMNVSAAYASLGCLRHLEHTDFPGPQGEDRFWTTVCRCGSNFCNKDVKSASKSAGTNTLSLLALLLMLCSLAGPHM